MSLDQLISKYLDGELSSAEDALLRDMVGKDTESKAKFDAYIDLHHEIKEDAKSIHMPQDLFRETEDLIMMRIMNETPAVVTKIRPAAKRVSFRKPLIAAALLLIAFSSAIKIGDSTGIKFFDVISPSNTKSIAAKAESKAGAPDAATAISEKSNAEAVPGGNDAFGENTLIASASPAAAMNGKAYSEQNNIRAAMTNANAAAPGMTEAKIGSAEAADMAATAQTAQNSQIPVSPLITEADNSTGTVAAMNMLSGNPAPDIKRSSPMQRYTPTRIAESVKNTFTANGFDIGPEVNLTTFGAFGLARSGFKSNKDKPIYSFSESISYTTDKVNKYGIEGGFMEYTIDDIVYVNVPSSTTGSVSAVVEGFDPTSKRDYFQVPVIVNDQKRLIWGTVFYERELIDNPLGSLHARLGLGGSSDGLMSYGRLYGKLHIAYGIFLTAGAEGKLFDAKERVLSGDPASMKSTISLIYGIQFGF